MLDKLVFFGSSDFSIYILNELFLHNIKPILIITLEDKPKGRKLVLTQNIVKQWAIKNNISCLTPKSLRDENLSLILRELNSNMFLIASYGKIIPKEIFEIPKMKTLNIHPSMLPKYRGASPIQSQILDKLEKFGVTIMKIEETMDTGPIISQKEITLSWQLGRIEIEKILAREGARIFIHSAPKYISGSIEGIIQNENESTYCKKITKEDGKLGIDTENFQKNSEYNLSKIKAYEGWPGTYFFMRDKSGKEKRVIIKEATIDENRNLKIIKVLPEGKNVMPFEDFLRGN